jgi:hypothetical protein
LFERRKEKIKLCQECVIKYYEIFKAHWNGEIMSIEMFDAIRKARDGASQEEAIEYAKNCFSDID